MTSARRRVRPRWREYRTLLADALAAGYSPVGLTQWVLARPEVDRALVVRHDVDRYPRSALEVAAVEAGFGLRSTWYFRWRTAHPDVVSRIRAAGHDIGLHYETLSRRTLAGLDTNLEACREELAREVAAFIATFGPIQSICAHGDTRVPAVRNLDLVDGVPLSRFQVDFEAYLATQGRLTRLTDRVVPHEWDKGLDPGGVFASGASPVLLLMHPNNWASNLSLALERLLARTRLSRLTHRVASGSDVPPL